MSWPISLANAPRGTRFLAIVGLLIVVGAWMIPQASLVDFFLHPVRANAMAHAFESAAAARVGWTIIGLSLWLFPLVFRAIQPAHSIHNKPAIASTFSKTLFALLALSIIVRLIRVNESLWYDEIAALATYVMHGPGVIMGNAFTTANHPLQSLLSWMSIPLSIDPGIRLPSILAGPVAVYATWKFTRQVASESIALVAAGAITCAPAAVFASGEARGYALAIALGALASCMMLSMLRQTHQKNTPLWYALFMSLATWAHLVTAFLAVGHLLVALWMMRRKEQRNASITAVFAVICAGFVSIGLWSPALPDLFHSRDQFLALTGNEPTLFGREGAALLEQLAGAYGWTAIPSALLVIIGMATTLRQPNLRLALAVTALGVPVAVLVAWLGNSWLYARFILFAMPATAFLISLALAWLWKLRPWFAITLAAITLATWSADILMRVPKQSLREAIAFVAAQKSPQDTVAIITPADNVGQWYALANNFELLPTGQNGSQLDECLRLTHPTPKWIVVLYPHSVCESAIGCMRLGDYKFAKSFPGWVDWGVGDIQVFQRDPSPPAIR